MEIKYPETLEFETASKKQISYTKSIVNGIMTANGLDKDANGNVFKEVSFVFKPEWASSEFTFDYSLEKITKLPKWAVSGFITAFKSKVLEIKEVKY